MASRYWVGGTGNWSNTARWSATSGGAGGASVPVAIDDVFFDANSGLNNATVTIDPFSVVVCNNLTITPSSSIGWTVININDSLTINGVFSTSGTAGNRRTLIKSSTKNFRAHLYVNSFSNLSDLDFKDLLVRTPDVSPLTGTRIGNHQNVEGVTFTPAKTVFCVLSVSGNWSSSTAWATAANGLPNTDNFPLAQDTARLIDNFGLGAGQTLTIDTSVLYIPTLDTTGRVSQSVNISFGQTNLSVFGSILNGNIPNFFGSSILILENEVNQKLLSNGRLFSNQTFRLDTLSGTFELLDAATVSIFTVTAGTFKTNNYNFTALAQISFSNFFKREIFLGSSTVTSNSNFIISNSTDDVWTLTLNADTSTIICAATLSTHTNVSLYNVRFQSPSQGATYQISGVLNCVNLILSEPLVIQTLRLTVSNNVNISGTFQALSTNNKRRITIGNFFMLPANINVNILDTPHCDFYNVNILGPASGTVLTTCGDCGNNTGIIFSAPKTLYLINGTNLNTSTWSLSSGGSVVDVCPLAQDTIIVDNSTIPAFYSTGFGFNFGTLNFSNRTTAFQLRHFDNNVSIFGDVIFSPFITTLGPNVVTFTGNKNQILNLNGASITFAISCAKNSGFNLELLSAFITAANITISSGIFKANTYNVTCNNFTVSASSSTTSVALYMGSGLWTLTGTGTVWNTNSNTNFIFAKETADILLSNNTTTARSFSGGNRPFNKLTIGGSTSTSQFTINDSSIFRELSSTKTVAHTISFNPTVTIQKWSISGTAGNLVTISGLSNLRIYGTVAVADYLAIGASASVSGETVTDFYVGTNSTGSAQAGQPIYFTAPPSARTLYWVGGTGNWSDTTKWSLSSGGAGGQSLPRSNDNVIFDNLSSSATYTVTVNTRSFCNNLTIGAPSSGSINFSGTSALNIHGNIALPLTGFTRTYSGLVSLAGTGVKTFLSNGRQLTSGGFRTCGDNNHQLTLSDAALGNFTLQSGKLFTSGYNLSGTITSQNISDTTLVLGSSTIGGISLFNSPDTIVDFGTSTISASFNFISISAPNRTLHNLIINQPGASCTIFAPGSTFNNVTISAKAQSFGRFQLQSNLTINGNLNLGSSTNGLARLFVSSDITGTTRTITASTFSASSDCDFRDIIIAGPIAPISGTRFGDCKGNSGIIFDAPKTVFWVGSGGNDWLSNSWGTVENGAASSINFPLPQDTARITNRPNAGQSISFADEYNISTIDMSNRVGALILSITYSIGGTQGACIYGNLLLNNNITPSGSGVLIFAGRNNQSITSSGKTFNQFIRIISPNGTVSLNDAFTNVNTQRSFSVINGTFNAVSYNFTSTSLEQSGGVINMGSGLWTISGSSSSSGQSIVMTGGVLNKDTANIVFTDSAQSIKNLTLGEGNSYNRITFANTQVDQTYLFQSRRTIIGELASTNTTSYVIRFNSFVQPRINKFSIEGTLNNLVTIRGVVSSSPSFIDYTGSDEVDLSYSVIDGLGVYPRGKFYIDSPNTNTVRQSFNISYRTVAPALPVSNFFMFF